MLNLPENFETDRLLIRRLHTGDASAIFEGYASKSGSTQYVSWPTHQSIKETYDFLQLKQDDWEKGRDYAYALVMQSSGQMIGCISAINEEGKVAIGYILNPSYESMGYTTEAVRSLVSRLEALPEVWRIWALCDEENRASQRVLQKAGFQKEGILKHWIRFINQNNEPKDCAFYIYPKSSQY